MTFGTDAEYYGHFEEGKRNGEGVYKYLKTKDLYSGSWKNVAYRSRRNTPGAMDKLRELLHKSVTYSLMVRRGDRTVISLPVLIFIVILLFLFKITAVALVVGLICGCRYSIENGNGENGGGAD